MTMTWPTKKLGDLSETVESINPKDRFKESFSYIDIASIDSSKKEITNSRIVDIVSAPSRARQLVRTNDILFATTRPYLLNIAQVKEILDGAIASTGFCVIRPRIELLNPDFAFLAVTSEDFVEEVLVRQKGATYPAVSNEEILNLSIPFPPLVEQKRIVKKIEEIFFKIDHALEARKEAKGNAAKIMQAGVDEIFEDRKKNGYEEVELENLIEMSSGDFLPSSGQISGPYKIYGGNGVLGTHNQYNCEVKTIVIGRVGAQCGAIHITEPQSWITDNALMITKFSEKIHLAFLVVVLRNLNLNQFAKTSAQPSISQTTIKKIKISLPPIAEQKKIVARLDILSEKVQKLQTLQDETERDLKALKRAILERAFAGKLL